MSGRCVIAEMQGHRDVPSVAKCVLGLMKQKQKRR